MVGMAAAAVTPARTATSPSTPPYEAQDSSVRQGQEDLLIASSLYTQLIRRNFVLLLAVYITSSFSAGLIFFVMYRFILTMSYHKKKIYSVILKNYPF